MKPVKSFAVATLALCVASTALSSAYAFPGGDGPGFGKRGSGPMQMFDRFDANGDDTITKDEVNAALQEEFTTADTTGSGDITLEEWKVAFANRAQQPQVRMFQRFDGNGDGQITKEEFLNTAERMSSRMERMQQRMAKWDGERGEGRRGGKEMRGDGPRDGDGPRQGRRHGQDGPGGFMKGAKFASIDTNGDKKLSAAELSAYADTVFADGNVDLDGFKAIWAEWSEPMMVRSFQRMDADGSLTVTLEEFTTHAQFMFDRFDQDGDGSFTKTDLREAMKQHKRGGWGDRDGRRGDGPRDGSGPRNGAGPDNG
ncbi:EF-hand domain-containing protein [Pseudovibrio exalbescens]|uniref:EF-hand domain-containing protein n=1 Tax=Pseudovibrio exalbescens TaxID=197461 RepID=UPI002365C234|nr:EF-hand domain-containing protein [Pseudovibrio exalbescens]MDD7909206.1 EF-hand domain-containing protein [Pseudovibrio exalbescens]